MEKINIASFDIDTDKLLKSIAQTRAEIENTKLSINELKKESKSYSQEINKVSSEIDKQRKTQKFLEDQLKRGKITQEQYNKEMQVAESIIESSTKELNDLTKIQRQQQSEISNLNNKVKNYSETLREEEKLLNANRKASALLSSEYTTEGKSINQLRDEKKTLIALRNAENGATDESRKRIDQLNKAIEENTQSQKENVSENEKRFFQIGQYREQLQGLFEDLKNAFLTGDLKGATSIVNNFFDNTKTNLKSTNVEINNTGNSFKDFKNLAVTSLRAVGNALRSLFVTIIANPITALVVGVGALATATALAVKEVFDYNNSIRESVLLTEQLTGATGESADAIRVRASALSESFGDDFNEILRTANAIAQSTGESFETIFNQIEQGYIRGANSGKDYLDQLREYTPVLSQYGFKLEDVNRITIEAQKRGIFNDKMLDSIKEAEIALGEFTPAQEKALSFAFGEKFAQDIKAGFDKGADFGREALLRISKELEKTELTTQQLGTLTADVFKGAGEDAGGVIVVLDVYRKALGDALPPLTDLQQATLELSQLNYELAQAKDEALKSDTAIAFQQQWRNTMITIETYWYKFLSAVREVFTSIDTWTKVVGAQNRATWSELPNIVRAVVRDVIATLSNLGGVLSDIGKLFNQAFSFDYKGVEDTIKKIANTEITSVDNFKKAIKDVVVVRQNAGKQEIANINKQNEILRKQFEIEQQRKMQQKSVSNLETPIATTPRVAQAQERVSVARSNLVSFAEQELTDFKRLNDAQIKDAELKLQEFNRLEQKRLENSKVITNEILNQSFLQYEEELKLKNQIIEKDFHEKAEKLQNELDLFDKKKELTEQEKINLEALGQEQLNLEKEKNNEILQNEDELNKKKLDLRNKYDTQIAEQERLRQSLEFEQKLLDLESRNATEFEIQSAKLENETQLKLDKLFAENELLRESDQENFDINQEIQVARDELQSELLLEKDEKERQRISNQLQLLTNLEQEFGNKQLSIENSVNQAKIQGKIAVLQGVGQLLGQETAIGKAVALGQLALSKAEAISTIGTSIGVANAKAVAASPLTTGQPFVGINTAQLLGAIASVGSGIAQAIGIVSGINTNSVSQGLSGISSGLKKAQKGMILEGASHSEGGIPIKLRTGGMIEAEGGEAIINRKSTAKYKPLLSAINSAGGGVKFANGGIAGSLGSIQRTITETISLDVINDTIANSVREGSMQGTMQGSESGFGNLVENKNIQRNADI